MFSRPHAEELRNLAPPLDCSAAAPDSGLLRTYLDHYSLRFTSDDGPVHHSLGFFAGGGENLAAQYFAPPAPRGTVFLLHGYLDHAGIYRHPLGWCLDRGYAAFIFDMPGHGLSSGEMGGVDNFARYCDALSRALALAAEQRLARPWNAVGQSTGAAVLMDTGLHHGLMKTHALDGMVLFAPLVRILRHYRSRMAYLLSGWFVDGTPRLYAESSHDREFLHFLRHEDDLQSSRIPRSWIGAMFDYGRRFTAAAPNPVPLTVVQGTGDDTVDWKFNLPAIRGKFPAVKEVLVPGARHHLVNESPEFRDPVFRALADSLSGSM